MPAISMVLDDTLLDDPARLAATDTAGLLRASAMAGAQVRSAAECAAEAELADRLDLGRPRSLVLLARPGVAGPVTSLLAALLAHSCPVPVVVSDLVPEWAGALDVVVAHTADPGDRELASSLERACRHGATVVLSGPAEGPVASSIAGRGVLLTPRVQVPAELAFPSALATGLLTVNALGLMVADVHELADQLDAEAERDQLGHESFVNPAKSLALRVAERTPLLWGLDQVAVAVAGQAAHALAAQAGVVCDVADYRQALARPALHRAVVREAGERDIFADPDDVDSATGMAPQVLLLSVRGGQLADALRHQTEEMLPSGDVLSVDEEIDADVIARAAVLALRCELAAIYLGLALGSVGEQGRYPSVTA